MSSTVVQSSEFNVSNITFSQVKLLDSGGKQAYLNYGGRSLAMQTASMAVPYGMNVFDKAGPIKYSVDLSFRGHEEAGSKVKVFYDAMQALDDFMIEQGVKNSKAWFKSTLTADVVRAFYTPVVRIPRDANGNVKPYPPTLKVSLKKKNGSDSFDIHCYDSNKQLYENTPLEELLVKGAQATVLIQCTGVWFAGSKFGLSWKAIQLRVDKLPDAIRGFAFADDDDAPSAPAATQARVVAKKAPVPAPAAAEEDEMDDDDEVFSAPAPAPAPAKSVLAAVAPAAALEDEEDSEPVLVPKKKVVTKKTIAVVKK